MSTRQLAAPTFAPLWPMGKVWLLSWYMCRAMPICLRLLEHFMRAAASRTFWTAGSSRPIRMAMMAMTTSSSISVNASRAMRPLKASIRHLRCGANEEKQRPSAQPIPAVVGFASQYGADGSRAGLGRLPPSKYPERVKTFQSFGDEAAQAGMQFSEELKTY